MKPSPNSISLLVLLTCIVGTLFTGLRSHGKDSELPREKKKVLIIRGASTHGGDSHNNDEVGLLIKDKLEASQYAESLEVQTTFNYPEDLSLVENADLIIISSDGGAKHVLGNKADPTKHMKHLDGVLKKNKTGLIVIHWATDAPSGGMGQLHRENARMMMDWIGAVYYWVNKGNDPASSFTWKFPKLDLEVDKSHPISNGLPERFTLKDEYYFNFFTVPDGRNPGSDQVTFLHSANAPSYRGDIKDKEKKNWRHQAVYWSFERENGGRSVAMTSAHFYRTWANPHFFQSFANSVFWTLGLEVPEDGVNIPTPTAEELLSYEGTKLY
ncbi:ThuA domain-containing protein [Roseibacillus persicicus]|uniref:ThuA domain-containing protein n=1 Tax=Roseibacillus persicicus TaxID=454148 RepID=UPI001675F1E9|nr:ThuA domain-containing protein [Roseibacillus persicicus]